MNDENQQWVASAHWTKSWRMRAAAWQSVPTLPDYAFQTLTSPGDFAPAIEPFHWSFHSGLDIATVKPGAITMLGNGMLYRPGPGEPRFFYFVTAPGVVVGQTRHPVPPSLFSAEYNVHEAENMQWIDAGNEQVVLVRHPQNGAFALACAQSSHEDTVHLAESALASPPSERLASEWLARRPFWIQMESSACPREVLAYGFETLTSALRGPEGVFPARWSETYREPVGAYSFNDCFFLVAAWGVVDQAIAEEHVQCALVAVQTAGRLPAWMTPDGHYANHAAWPLLADCTRRVLDNGAHAEFISFALPLLQTYLEATWAWFNADDIPVWRHPEEAYIPDTFDEQLATVDLAVFLRKEMDAMLAIAAAHPEIEWDTARYKEQRDHITRQLLEMHWDPVTRCFHDRYVGKERIKRTTIGSFFPLGLADLPADKRAALVSSLTQRKDWKQGHGITAWEYWESDPIKPPVLAHHQHILLHALSEDKEDGLYHTFAKMLRAQCARNVRHDGSLADHLKDPSDTPTPSPRPSLTGAALILDLEAEATALERAVSEASPLVQWMDRYRLPLTIGLTTLLSVLVLGVVLFFLFKRAPTTSGIGTMSSLAQRHYEDGRYDEAARLYRELIDSPRVTFFAHQQLGNTLFRKQDYKGAEEQYREALALNGDSPASYRNLAVSLHRQGRDQEAIAVFEEMIERFESQFPTLVEQARIAIELLNEKQPYRDIITDDLEE